MNKDFFKLPDKVLGINVSFLKLFVVPFLVLVGFIVTLNLIIVPKFSELTTLNKSISLVNEQISLTNQKINYLSSIDQQQIQNDVAYLESAVLQEKNAYFLVGIIRQVADKYNFSLTTFSIGSLDIKSDESSTLKVANADVATKMPLTLTLEGPDEKRVEMITALEKTLPILFVDSLDISSSGGTSNLEMTISSYYIAEKNDLVSGNLSLSDLIPTQEENDLLQTISSYNKVESGLSTLGSGGSGTFVEYERENPFTL